MTARLLIVVITVTRKARRLRRQYVLKSTFQDRPVMSVRQSEIVPEAHLKARVAAVVITPVGAEGTFADNVKENKPRTLHPGFWGQAEIYFPNTASLRRLSVACAAGRALAAPSVSISSTSLKFAI